MTLRPFWNYYGGKWRSSKRYPAPSRPTVVEPFAGAAGYSLRHYKHDVLLIDIDPVVVGVWSWLIQATPRDVLDIPIVDNVDDLPPGTPAGAAHLVGFLLNTGTARPCKTRSAWAKKGGACYWGDERRARIAHGVSQIKHWRVQQGSYHDAPDVPASWFVDPPYNNSAGERYVHGRSGIDYTHLGSWCQSRKGQVIVCENTGADWLPFHHMMDAKANQGRRSAEAVWVRLE